VTTLGYIAFVIVLLIFSVWTHCELYRYGFRKGREAADKWWMGADTEVDRERVKIWREEG
jgi:hypothetical protein